MRSLCLPVLALVSALSPCVAAQDASSRWRVEGENTGEYYFNDVDGPGVDSSYLERGGSVLNELSLRVDYDGPAVDYQSDLVLRATDNRRLDDEDFSVERLTLRRRGTRTDTAVGDFFGSFSQYSLTTTLKGAQWQWLPSTNRHGLQVTGIAGVRKSNWEYLWQDEATETKDSFVYGLRTGGTLGPSEINLNYIFAEDKPLPDISENAGRSGTEVFHNSVWSTDWRLRLADGAIRLDGESAISRNDSNMERGETGHGHRIRAYVRTENHRTSLGYEFVEPEFSTIVGSAASDREQIRLRSRYTPVTDTTLSLHYTFARDNLHGQLGATTRSHITEYRATRRGLFGRDRLSATAGLRNRRRRNGQTDPGNVDSEVNTALFELSDRLGDYRVSSDYEYRIDRDRSEAGVDTHSHRVGANVSTRWNMPFGRLRPFLRGQWESHALKDDDSDRDALMFSGGIAADLGENWDVSLSSTVLEVQSDALDADNASRQTLVDCRYHIRGNRDSTARLRYTNGQQELEAVDRNYREGRWQLSWLRRF